MLVPISEVTKELGIEPHQLHKWEDRGWLGSEPVLKDPDNNGQRIYNEEQLERIRYIQQVIEEQRKKGIKRTNIAKMNERLLDKFGGEVTKRESEIMVIPSSFEAFMELIQLQNKKITELEETVRNQSQLQLPQSLEDHMDRLKDMQDELKFSREREEKLISLIERLQDDVEELKHTPKKSRWKFWG